MREKILEEIRRLTETASGRAPGARLFTDATGIRESAWRGVYWARWSDALAEAGAAPNLTSAERRIPDDVIFQALAEVSRHYRRTPTVAELRLYKRSHSDFPHFKTFERRFAGFSQIGAKLRAWADGREGYADLIEILSDGATLGRDEATSASEGTVYLLQSGAFYKIGRSDEIERRLKEIRVALPDAAKLVHTIRTDDPSGIEAYWHRRFADKRANGEWFKLDRADVTAFRRRRFQ